MASNLHPPLERIYHSHIIWNIHNFFNGPLAVDLQERFESPEFVINLPQPITWRLGLTAKKGWKDGHVTEILLHRCGSYRKRSYQPVKVRLAIFGDNGYMFRDIGGEMEFSGKDSFRIGTPEIYRNLRSYQICPEFNSGKLTITCDFLLDDNIYVRDSDINVDLNNLSNQLGLLYALGNFTDLCLKVAGKIFPVHGAIVKARSPHVARILQENPDLREIDLTKYCSIPQIKGLIEYWYSGDIYKMPKTTCLTTSNFIRNMEQHDMRPYVDPDNIIMSTTFETFNMYISWVIDDVNFCKGLKCLERYTCSKYTLKELSWKLYFYPKGVRGTEEYITLYIEELGETIGLHPVYIEVFFTDESGREYGCRKTISFLNSPGKYRFPSFMTHSDFSRQQGTLLTENILRIGCRIHYGTGRINNAVETFPNYGSETRPDSYRVLANALKNLLQSEDMSDITLTARGKRFKAHKAILAARSVYFYSLLSKREYKTSTTAEIELEDIEPEDVDRILKYMYYAEKIELNWELALRLYPVLHKYKIHRLICICSHYLRRHVTVDSALDVLELADTFKDLGLILTGRELIRSNWTLLSGTERWRTYQRSYRMKIAELIRSTRNSE